MNPSANKVYYEHTRTRDKSYQRPVETVFLQTKLQRFREGVAKEVAIDEVPESVVSDDAKVRKLLEKVDWDVDKAVDAFVVEWTEKLESAEKKEDTDEGGSGSGSLSRML